jgi:RNA-binding protein YhbY
VYAVSRFGEKTQLVVHYSANDEGVLEAEWPAVLKAGCYGLIVTGFLEGEGQWTMRAGDAVKVTTVTEKGSESVTMIADSYDVKAVITVCVGTKGVTEELRQEIADMIEEEYNASERVRESNEHDREIAEGIREQNEGGRVEAEQLREQAEGERQTTFETNERERQGDYEEAEGTRNQSYQNAEAGRTQAFEQAEALRDQSCQQAAGNANQKAQYAEQQGDYAKNQGDYAKRKADEIEDAKGTYDNLDARLDAMDAATGTKMDAPTEEEFNGIFN